MIRPEVHRYDVVCRGDGFDHDIETLIKSRVLKDDEYLGDLEPATETRDHCKA